MTKELTPQVIVSALQEMGAELLAIRKEAVGYMAELDDMKPEELTVPFEGGGAPNDAGSSGKGGDDEVGGGPDEAGSIGKGPGGSSKHQIKTPEDAKKVLEDAKSDIKDVIDHLDEASGGVSEEAKSASYQRPGNQRFASNLKSLAKTADSAIKNARDAMAHWAFLKENYNPVSKIQNSQLKQAAETIKEVGVFNKMVSKLLGGRTVEATATPPTGAEFSGDKWPEGKNPAEVELRHWHSGADKFNKDKSWEDKRPNSAVEPRLQTDHEGGYSRNESEFVNSSLYFDSEKKFGSFWEIVDTKSGKKIVAAFEAIPSELGPRNDATFKLFTSKKYGEAIVNHVMKYGLDKVATELNGQVLEINAPIVAEARAPKVKNVGEIRKYYADAYGDKAFAKGMTSAQKDAASSAGSSAGSSAASSAASSKKKTAAAAAEAAGSAAGSSMNVGYSPADDAVSAKNKGEDTGKAKDGPGTLSSQEEEVLYARARRSVELAKKLASRNPEVPFTKEAILGQAREYMKLDDATFATIDATLEQLPIVNEAALVEAHIPDTETGIVGNKAEGVREPKASVKTDGVDKSVSGDAKVQKMASIVPQLTVGENTVRLPFTTTAGKLGAKGIDVSKLRLPKYRQG
jgi:hypothetical protein